MNNIQKEVLLVACIGSFIQSTLLMFLNLYSFFYAINHISFRERSLSTMLGSLTSVIILEFMSRKNYIEYSKKYANLSTILASIICGIGVYLLETYPLLTVIINATVLVVTIKIILTAWSDYENTIFNNTNRTIFGNRIAQMDALAGFVASVLCWFINDMDISKIINYSIIIVILVCILDLWMLKYLREGSLKIKQSYNRSD